MCKDTESMVPSPPPLLETPGKAEMVYGLRQDITPYFLFFFLSLQNCFPWDSVLLCPRSKGFIFHEQMSDNFIVFYNPFSCLILLACDLMLNISETPHADCSGHFETIWIETTGQQIQRESQAINHQQTSRRVFSHTLWGEG